MKARFRKTFGNVRHADMWIQNIESDKNYNGFCYCLLKGKDCAVVCDTDTAIELNESGYIWIY